MLLQVKAFMTARLIALLVGIFIILCLPLAALRIIFAALGNPPKAWSIYKAFDLTGNVLINGKFNEYISTRAYRAMVESQSWGCVLCKVLDWFQKDHCKRSVNPDKPN